MTDVGFVRRTVVGLTVLVVSVAAGLAWRQRVLPAAFFEFGVDRVFEGTVATHGAPRLVVTVPDTLAGDYLVVGGGKHGAHDAVAHLDGRRVTLTGSRIVRGARLGLELHGVVAREASTRRATPAALGRVTLRGEIVDAKCWLGVMNPGDGKVHRGCAARCISGGLPPLLVLAEPHDGEYTVLLTGMVPEELVPWVAEPVEVEGDLTRDGAWLVLHILPERIRRPPRS